MEWDQPAPTLTTQFYGFGSGRFGHPEQDRGLSLREGAILQGFPRRYRFVPEGEPIHFKALGRLIGNAVPVDLGQVIGESILEYVSRGCTREVEWRD
jgi:DNA (cytosine-5)-methyltransferase 1